MQAPYNLAIPQISKYDIQRPEINIYTENVVEFTQ